MKTEVIQTLTLNFEARAQETESGAEFWLARELQHLLGYAEWRNFTVVLDKAKAACELVGHPIKDHFVAVNKMVELGSGSQRELEDLMLSRYACYLVAQNGDSKKQPIAFAQSYFALQTRRAEVIQQRLLDVERYFHAAHAGFSAESAAQGSLGQRPRSGHNKHRALKRRYKIFGAQIVSPLQG